MTLARAGEQTDVLREELQAIRTRFFMLEMSMIALFFGGFLVLVLVDWMHLLRRA